MDPWELVIQMRPQNLQAMPPLKLLFAFVNLLGLEFGVWGLGVMILLILVEISTYKGDRDKLRVTKCKQ